MFGKKILSMFILSGGLVLAGCSANESVGGEEKKETTQEEASQAENVSNVEVSKGEELSDILTSTNWQGTKVYDEEGNDLTEENSGNFRSC